MAEVTVESAALADPAASPGILRRAAAGAWHIPAGFLLLLRTPRLWPLALLPSLLALACLLTGFGLAVFALPTVESALGPAPGSLPTWIALLVLLALWAGTLAAGVVLGLAVALLLAAPVLERLSHRTEVVIAGDAPGLSAGMRWELAQSLRSAAYFLAVAPFVLLLGLIPLLGPALAALWAAHALAVQQTEAPLVRRGLGFHDRRQWHRRWRAESLGFGLAAFLTLLVPLANLLLAPALAVGATLLVVDLEGTIEAAPVPEDAAPSLEAEDPATS